MKNLVTSFEEACQVKGYDPEKVCPDLSTYPEKHRKAVIAASKLFIIQEVITEDHEFDWNDYNEDKYYPVFDLEKDPDSNPSGFRFYYAYYVRTGTNVGARLVYRTREEVHHVVKHFETLYRDLMTIE